jgi:hypothetical protein
LVINESRSLADLVSFAAMQVIESYWVRLSHWVWAESPRSSKSYFVHIQRTVSELFFWWMCWKPNIEICCIMTSLRPAKWCLSQIWPAKCQPSEVTCQLPWAIWRGILLILVEIWPKQQHRSQSLQGPCKGVLFRRCVMFCAHSDCLFSLDAVSCISVSRCHRWSTHFSDLSWQLHKMTWEKKRSSWKCTFVFRAQIPELGSEWWYSCLPRADLQKQQKTYVIGRALKNDLIWCSSVFLLAKE